MKPIFRILSLIPLLGLASANAAEAEKPVIAFSGLIDLYYGFNFNRPVPVAVAADGLYPAPSYQNRLRNFDFFHNQFGLNLVELGLQRTAGEVAFKVDLDFGETTDWIHGPGGVNDQISKHVGQALVSYRPAGVPGLTLGAGKMATHLGLELIKARDNWQYSRSMLFASALPYWHLGVTASYAWIPGELSTMACLYNGWNNLFDNNSAKSLGFQLAWTPAAGLAAYYNLITGPEQALDNSSRKTVHEANLTYVLLPGIVTMATDLALGNSRNEPYLGVRIDTGWTAWTLALKYQVSPRLSLSPRFEIFDDRHGIATSVGNPVKLRVLTFTSAILLSDQLETRLEFRRDSADSAIFSGSDGTSKSQASATAALLYSF